MIGKSVLFIAIFCASVMVAIEGKRLLLRPISAAEVRRILKNANREDAIPEGRVISHGIAAIKGFTLGFKKGVVGVAIADGIAALTQTPGSANSAAVDASEKPSASFNDTTNELCFTSRSARADIVASGNARQELDVPDGEDTDMDSTSPTTSDSDTNTNTGSEDGSIDDEGSITTSGLTQPTTSDTHTNTNTGSGAGFFTKEGSITTTMEDEPTVNCIVIKKNH